jgi:hypothetical protein
MYFGTQFTQVQMWPSPKFWEGKKLALRTVADTAEVNLALSSFVQVVPVDRNAGTEPTFANMFLNKWDNGGPAGDRTLTDDSITNLTLSTFINYVAVSNSVTDTANADTQLTLFVSPTAVQQTFTEPSNAALALTKWTQ